MTCRVRLKARHSHGCGARACAAHAAGPAAAAGLIPGDVVTAVGSTRLDADHPLDPTVLGLAPGQQVSLTVYRNGASRSIALTVGSG